MQVLPNDEQDKTRLGPERGRLKHGGAILAQFIFFAISPLAAHESGHPGRHQSGQLLLSCPIVTPQMKTPPGQEAGLSKRGRLGDG